MPLLPVLTIILPLAGAGGILGLSLIPRIRPYTRYVALVAVSLTTVLILVSGGREPVSVILSLWQPSLLFGAVLTLRNYAAAQPLAFALALATCSGVLVELGRVRLPDRSAESYLRLAATGLALLAASLMALWAANVLTMVVSWAIYDLLLAIGRVVARGSGRTVNRGLILGSLATLLLWGGTLLPDGGSGGEVWSLMTPSDAQLALWAAAGVLRLCVYPFHLSVPDDLDVAFPLATPLFLDPVVGWGLWLRLTAVSGGSILVVAWVPVLAAVTMALGGFLAWSCESRRCSLPWIGVGATGAMLLAAVLAGERAAAIITAGGVSWTLGMGLLFLKNCLIDVRQRQSRWWRIPPLVGALALLGLPLTLGFVMGATLVRGIAERGHLGWGGAFFFGNLFLIPALVRWLRTWPWPSLSHERDSLEEGEVGSYRWLAVPCGIGLAMPMLLLIIAGLVPSLILGRTGFDESIPLLVPSLGRLLAMPGLMGWLLWTISIVAGGLLAWQDEGLRFRIESLFGAIHDLLRLEWLYDVTVGALERGLSVLRGIDEVVGGAGALLWSLLIFFLLFLMLGSM